MLHKGDDGANLSGCLAVKTPCGAGGCVKSEKDAAWGIRKSASGSEKHPDSPGFVFVWECALGNVVVLGQLL